MRVLVVDDEKIKRVSLADDLAAAGYTVACAASGEAAVRQLKSAQFEAVVTDMRMPGMSGIELLKWIKSNDCADTEVILMTAYGSFPLAVEAIKHGAFDFIAKPFRNERMIPLLKRIGCTKGVPGGLATRAAAPATALIAKYVIGSSEAMQPVKRMIQLCAESEANVLLRGETGVGKDLLASVIHQLSPRGTAPFVKANCAGFPAQLIESELYGHEKGAFTGADEQKLGRLDLAEGGVLYLDDVDDIPLSQQVKLLRVIDEKIFERVGGTSLMTANVRIVASTKVDLLEKISAGEFREDLYYRLNVLRVDIPPLRERHGDIPLLVDHFLRSISGAAAYRVEPEAMKRLDRHPWPGNIRELAATLERSYLVGGGVVTAAAVALDEGLAPKPAVATGSGFHDTVGMLERELLADALKRTGGRKSQAAKLLDMKLSTFRDKLAKYDMA